MRHCGQAFEGTGCLDAAKALGPFRRGRRSPSRHSRRHRRRRCRQRATGRTRPLLPPAWRPSRLARMLPAPSPPPWARACLAASLTWQPPLSTFMVTVMPGTSASHHSHGPVGLICRGRRHAGSSSGTCPWQRPFRFSSPPWRSGPQRHSRRPFARTCPQHQCPPRALLQPRPRRRALLSLPPVALSATTHPAGCSYRLVCRGDDRCRPRSTTSLRAAGRLAPHRAPWDT